jgi:Na+/melibiose symporter-like transporter
MVALVWWIIGVPQHGAFSDTSLIPLAVAVAGLGGFVYWENATSEPMVPLVLFRHRNFSGGSLSLALVEIANGGLLLVFTQYLQFVLGYSPVQAGLAFVPLAIGALVGNIGGAKAGTTIGPRFLVLGGMLVMAASFGLLAMVSATTGFAIPAIALGLLGLGAGVAMPAAVGALMSTIPPDKAGVGSALNDTIQQAGSALGIAILGSLLAGGFTRHMPAGAPGPARRSITGAFAVAHGDTGLIHAAREAYTAAMSTTFTVGAIGVLAAAVLATLVIRNAKPEPVATPEHELVA